MVSKKINDCISALYVNGMAGRQLRVPGTTKNGHEFFVVYGHHSSLERWWGLAQAFADYGTVVMPDLPGFGGMDSFYSIGQKPTLDAYADYIASLIKMRYKHRKVTLVGISFGFIVLTRMLQRHPSLVSRVEILVSAAGFVHKSDFKFTKLRRNEYMLLTNVFKHRPFNWVFRYAFLNKYMLRAAYSKTHNARVKFAEAGSDKTKFNQMMDMEIALWQNNDVRTYMQTTIEMLTVDNTKKPIDTPVWYIYTEEDNYFRTDKVDQHLRQVFDAVHPAKIPLKAHVVSVVATKQEAASLIPSTLRKMLK